MAKIITYECSQCGSEVTVTEQEGACMSPIYCCGVVVAKARAAKKTAAKPKKAAAKKPAAKKAAQKKKTVAKKKTRK